MLAQPKQDISLAWVERYLESCRTQKSLASRTMDLYALHLQGLLERASAQDLSLLTVENTHIRQWVMKMRAQGLAPKSLSLVLSAWRGFYKWLVEEQQINHNPCLDVRPVRAGKSLPKALAVDDAVHLANHKGRFSPPQTRSASAEFLHQWREARDAAMVEMLYGSGLRISEVLSLNTHPDRDNSNWIDCDSAQVHVTGKGGKKRSVPVGSKAVAAVSRWLLLRTQLPSAQEAQETQGVQETQQGQALFINTRGGRLSPQAAWQNLRRRGKEAGLAAPVSPHMLRHSCASHMLQSSGDLRGVQEMLGHASITTTQIYTRLDFQHLSDVYDKSHPRAQARD